MPEPLKKSPITKVNRFVLKVFIWIFGITCLVSLASYITMNHFGEHIMKRYLQRKIHQTSRGVYTIDFDRFSFNIFTGKTTVTDFHLVPDETRYQELREKGEIKRILYSLDYEKLTLNNLDIKEAVLSRIIHLRLIELDKPTITFVAYPDSIVRKRDRFKQIYHDIYPVLSILFSEVKVDSVLIRDGSISGKETSRSGITSEGDWLYSATLRDFDLNAYEYYQDDRIFYSRDVELRIRNFNYSLSDSLYLVNADEVGFSLSGSRLFGKGLTLTPNFHADHSTGPQPGIFYQGYLPEFSIDGVDLFKALLEKEISIQTIRINDLEVKMFLHQRERPVNRKNQSRVTVATLYTIIRDKLKKVTIDTLVLNHASFKLYPATNSSQPEMKVDRATLQLHQFLLDSLAHLDTTKILYARDIELDLEGFTLALEDKLHDLRARKVLINTQNSLIDVRETRLYPSPVIQTEIRHRSNSLYQMYFPQVRFEQVNLLRMFNTKNLEFDRLMVQEPDITIVQYRSRQMKEDSLEARGTFLEKLDLIKNVVIPYMVSVDAGTIEVSNARISFRDDQKGRNEERISGLVDLTLTGLHLDTLTNRNRKEFLSKVDLKVEVRDFHYLSPDSLHRVSFRELFANSVTQDLDISGFDLHTSSRQKAEIPRPSVLTTRFSSLQVRGFDYPRWISGQWFCAKEIRLEDPWVAIRSVRKKRESSLNEPFEETDEAIKKIEIGNIRIDRGWFDLAEEYPANTSSLLVRNFDFQVSNLMFDLTGWDDGVKVFRYDILSMSPDPAYPILLDSTYAITFSRFLSDSYPPNLTVSQLHLVPMHNGKKISTAPVTIEVSLPALQIRKLELEQALFDRDIRIDDIRITEPVITLVRQHGEKKHSGQKQRAFSGHPELKTPFHALDIGTISLTGGMLHLVSENNGKKTQLNLDRITTTIRGFRYDSIRVSRPGIPLFYCDDIDLQTGGYSMLTKDSMNTLSLGDLHLSTAQAMLVLDSIALTPNYSDYNYSRKLGYQTNRMELSTGKITLERLDFLSLVEKREIISGSATIDGLVLDDYRDKRVAVPVWKRPPMIQQAIREISFSVSIDTVKLTNGKVTYREQTGEEAGMIFFDRIDLIARNFTTDSTRIARGAVLMAEGSTRLMGQAPVHGSFMFPLNAPTDTFFFSGRSGQVDMTLFNPMIERVTPLRVQSGVVDSLKVEWMRGNDEYATGILDLYYHDLRVKLLKRKRNFWDRGSTDLLQVLVNMAVPSENPGYFGIHRSGYIWNRRNVEKGYFNFFWKALLTGLKSSEGWNSKEQRAFRRTQQTEGDKKRKK